MKKNLKSFYEMLYPEVLKENEYVRMVFLNKEDKREVIKFVKCFEEWQFELNKYKYKYDCYTQLATNKGCEKGTKTTQRCRKVLFFDFDKQDYLNVEDNIIAFNTILKEKFPKLFVHCYVSSGNGYHFYVAIKKSCDVKTITEINLEMAKIMGADINACKQTQIVRVPCTYNHKIEKGLYDYTNKDNFKSCKLVKIDYNNNVLFKPYSIDSLNAMVKEYEDNKKAHELLNGYREKYKWDYTLEKDFPCYLCINKVLKEGTTKGKRNFWLGRIIKMLQKQGLDKYVIHSECQKWNKLCEPPKSPKEVETDVESYLKSDYMLLGCYESLVKKGETEKAKWIEEECDKQFCGTYLSGTAIQTDSKMAHLNKKVLTNKRLREMSGNEYLVLTFLDVYCDTYGRKGYRIKDLKEHLKDIKTGKSCMSEPTFKNVISKLVQNGWIELIEKDSRLFDEKVIKQSRKLRDVSKGYISFYFSAANCLRNGLISQTAYKTYLLFIRNLSERKPITYGQIEEEIGIDKRHIGTYIKELIKAGCLVVQKRYSDNKRKYNHYNIVDSDYFNTENAIFDDELAFKLMC